MLRAVGSSIRFKIFLLYCSALCLTLFVFNLFIYLDFKDTQIRKIDMLLDARILAVESAVRAYWETQAKAIAAEPKPNWLSELLGVNTKKSDPEDPYGIIISYLTLDNLSTHPSDLKIHIDVYGDDGRPMPSLYHESGLPRLDTILLRRILQGRKVFYEFRMGPDQPLLRALVKPIMIDRQMKAIVQARVTTQPLNRQMQGLFWKLIARAVVVVLVASFGSFVLVHWTLRPVDEMTRRIHQIRTDNLDRRLTVPRTADEIARLAETFNAMLGRLEKSFRAQKQIVQDISHELKTPLTIIRGQIEVGLKKSRSAAEYEEILRSSLDEIERVRKIIDGLLLLARMDSRGHLFEMKSVDLNDLLKKVCQYAEALGQAKGIQVTFVQKEDVMVHGNDVYLERLFQNLIENAVKYNRASGTVTVTVEKGKDVVSVFVKDTGMGIPEEEIGRIFDRFYRVDRARQSGEGFGLGLSISRSIVEAHRGRIEVQSKMGQGSQFRVILPAGTGESFISKVMGMSGLPFMANRP